MFRMEEQGLRQKDVAEILGGKNRASEVLSGKRGLTLSMIRALHEKLAIPPELLIREPAEEYAAADEVSVSDVPADLLVKRGWVQRGDVTFDPKPASIDETIALARRFLGLPYTWGGTSSYGYDCSGFTQMLCRRRGAAIPRDARPQAEWGGVMAVEKEELQPGDLIYFGKGPEKRITHTGMYIGGGEFIHATAHEKPVIQISRVDDPHWVEAYAGARRLK